MLPLRACLLLILCWLPSKSFAQTAPLSPPPRVAPSPQPVHSRALLAPELSLRLQLVEEGLTGLAAQRRQRVLLGALQTSLGALFAGSALLVHEPLLRAGIAIAGGVATARGILQLSASPKAREHAARFASLPMHGTQQAEAKLLSGERSLARMARSEKRLRIVNASLSMLAAAAFVPAVWALERRDDSAYRFGQSAGDYVGLSLSVIGFASGLVAAFIPSETERFWREYRRLTAELNARPSAF